MNALWRKVHESLVLRGQLKAAQVRLARCHEEIDAFLKADDPQSTSTARQRLYELDKSLKRYLKFWENR